MLGSLALAANSRHSRAKAAGKDVTRGEFTEKARDMVTVGLGSSDINRAMTAKR